MTSIDDVAQYTGLSSTTVSHALSGKRKVSDKVREKVRAASLELGYAPSRSAQNLARGKTQIIALVVPDIGNGYFAELAKGVEQTAIQSGYNVILCTTGFNHEREILHLEMIRSRAVDGIVYAAGSPPGNSELVRLLGNLPLVLVDEEIAGASATAVVSDNATGGQLAAEYLLGLGHRRCLVLSANEQLISSTLRVNAFSAAWSAGGGHDPAVVSGGFTEEGGRQAVQPHIEALRNGEFTSIFAANDLMALGAIEELAASDVEVPGVVSVIGFDDIPPARYSRPGLTTIRQDVTALSTTATTTLVTALEGSETLDGHRHVIPVELIVRETAAPARKPLKG